ncbi:hypothetical protein SCP_0606830 [Sparassis crispa]|uniref:Uncharacterized protein n=1 Tax=Sparassis crispa TaxID=139825 RepID=A0A401GR68_9APHY|nr:hypothetical protein SCP_0606830 [Sparassis crispa]GBE84703.1 hypothetical protein SCP_0606830 [Sparassis crispa]
MYIPKNTMKKARTIIDKGHQKKKTGGGKNAGDEFDLSMAHMLLADCKIAEQNHLYDNLTTDPPCTCSSCQVNLRPIRSTCDCSGCVPEDLPDRLFPMKKAMNPVKHKDHLSRGMRDRGKDRLLQLRKSIYVAADSVDTDIIPEFIYLPDPVIKAILDRFALLQSIKDLDALIAGGVSQRSVPKKCTNVQSQRPGAILLWMEVLDGRARALRSRGARSMRLTPGQKKAHSIVHLRTLHSVIKLQTG